MSDWTGAGTTITTTPGADCLEYLDVDAVRAEFGEDVELWSDAQIQRKIDRLAAGLEDALGHTFGRGLVARSSTTDTVAVTATGIVIGGATYLFATYVTLGEIVAAVNAAGDTYSLEILPQVNPSTPSDLLSVRAAVACGPDYEDRAVLCLSAMYVQAHGDGSSYAFLPLPLASVTEVVENGTALDATGYWATAGENWIIKKLCGCATASSCYHPRGRWSNSYPANIAVTYVPQWWGRVPASLQAVMLDAFESQSALGPMQSESFGGAYSYSRAGRQAAANPWDVLTGGLVRQYQVRFQP